MPTKTSKKKQVPALPSIPKELIDQMVSGPMDAEAVNAASMAFKKALIERILGEVLPINSASGNLVKSVFEKENGLEEAVFRRADHRFFAAGRSRHTGQGTVSAIWFQ